MEQIIAGVLLMKDKVLHFNEKHQLFNRGDTLFLAVSGGPDSLALLHFFASIKTSWDLQLHTLTVDHQLRGQASKDDAQFVYETSLQYGIPCTIGQADVKQYAIKHNIGIQAAARKARYEFFLEQMKKEKKAKLVLGQHLDDQVESIVMQFIKGVRQKGMPIKRMIDQHELIRPFLCVTKDDIWQYVNKHQLEARIDQSNEDLTYTRNRVRKQIVPLLKKENPNLNESLTKVAQELVEEDQFLNELAEEKLKKIASLTDQKVTFSIRDFAVERLPLQRRMFHLILNYLQCNQVDKDYFSTFYKWLQTDKPNSELSFNTFTIIKSYEKIEVIKGKLMILPYEEKLHINESLQLPNGWTIHLFDRRKKTEEMSSFTVEKSLIKWPLIVRTRQDGDRIRPVHLNGTKKVKNIFIDAKIPKHERDEWPIVVNGDGEILWIPFLAKSHYDSASEDAVVTVVVER